MIKTYSVSPGRAGLARGEFKRLIISALTEPGTSRTPEEVATLLDANLNTVKSVKWALDHPEQAKETVRRGNRKQSLLRHNKKRAELNRLKKQLEEASQGVQLALPLPVPQPVLAPVQVDVAPKPDMVNSPTHYTDGGIETIDYIKAKLTREEYIGYLRGNIFKYTSRLGKKGDMEQDAGKLSWYSQELTKFLKGDA